jgi:Rod binding domain-containing protein
MDVSSILSSMAGSQAAAGDPALRNAQTPAAQRKAVAGQFEAIMLRQMLSGTMGSMLGGEDSPSGSVYGYLLTDVFAQKLAQGGGMGLSKMIEKQLTPAHAPAEDPAAQPPSA